jgi:hypothetical protein
MDQFNQICDELEDYGTLFINVIHGFGVYINLPCSDEWISILKQIKCPYKLNTQIRVLDTDLIKTIVYYDNFNAIELLSFTSISIGIHEELRNEIILRGSMELLRCFKQHCPKIYMGTISAARRICSRSDENMEMLEFMLDNCMTDRTQLYCLYYALTNDKLKIVKYLMMRYNFRLTVKMKILIIKRFSINCFTEFVKNGTMIIDNEIMAYIIKIHISDDKSKSFVKTILELADSGFILNVDQIIISLREKNGPIIDELLGSE